MASIYVLFREDLRYTLRLICDVCGAQVYPYVDIPECLWEKAGWIVCKDEYEYSCPKHVKENE